MNTIQSYFNQAQLSLAAYGTLQIGIINPDELVKSTVGMSLTQAADFATTYTVVDQYTDLASGFSATVFERGRQRYLAIRGTENWLDYIADADLALSGAAAKQTISLFNYIQRLSGVKGQTVAQLEWNGQDYVLSQTGAVGLLDTPLTGALSITGHSLGGHLAMAFECHWGQLRIISGATMPRRPRIKLAEVPQHVVQRGINREPCFFADEDYHCYLHWLKKSADDWHCVIHAYVLMTNHVHLLLTAGTGEGIAKMMQAMGRRYVQYINRSYRRTGTLWEGRYKSSLVQAETYLLTCMRYIELNPVRAGMMNDPSQYRWSSYRHNGLGQADTRIAHHPLYASLGADETARQAAYRALFRSQLDEEAIADIRLALTQGQPLGSDRFSEAMCMATGIRRSQKRPGRPAGALNQTSGTETQTGFGF